MIKFLRASKTSRKNNSVTNEEEIPLEKYIISPELRQNIIDDLRLTED